LKKGRQNNYTAKFNRPYRSDSRQPASAKAGVVQILWDVVARERMGEPLAGHKTRVNAVAFSPDGKTLASASDDQTVILWDVVARKSLGNPLAGHNNRVSAIAFSPDGKKLASASWDGTVILWDVAVGSWRDRACSIANRNLTCEEWRNLFADQPYRKVCERLLEPRCP
jgi:WD40 repeat protein